jgi:hypothetical protein
MWKIGANTGLLKTTSRVTTEPVVLMQAWTPDALFGGVGEK